MFYFIFIYSFISYTTLPNYLFKETSF